MMFPFLLAAVLAGDPSTTARTVVLHDMDIIPLYAQNGYVTEIHFPKGVQPMELRVGKPAFFRCNVSGNTLYIEPQDLPEVGGGERTTVNVPLTNGRHATFLVEEISKKRGAHADLKVFIQQDDADVTAPAFVPAEQLTAVTSEIIRLRQQLLEGQKQHAAETAAITQVIAQDVRVNYELFDRKGKPEFKPEIYSVKGFTYIKIDTPELPSVWSVKDGKPSKLNPTFANGLYEIQGVLEVGELSVGKSSIKFRKRG
ncbi:MAG: TrbG/VirB9 family P-type conjugative transfer protein [Bryobacteraceae bacterium]